VEKKRVVVAGQVPPPQGGQNLMIAQILQQLGKDNSFDTVHWPFFFSRRLDTMRRPGPGKIVELMRSLWRLLRIRIAGPIDLLIYPTGGPHLVPVIRDICLLPFARLASRKLIIQFHAAGIAEKLKHPNIFHRMLAGLMRQADSAIVMTNYNRVDPESLGIGKIDIVPIQLNDESETKSSDHSEREPSRLLYVGHLCPDKGTPELLEAFSNVFRDHPDLRLELMGEPLFPYTWKALEQDVECFGIEEAVNLSGVLSGAEKWQAFKRASLFVFPTVAPYESFGLVLVEAMMFGLPILTTDWRGNRDVVGDPPCGIVFPTTAPLVAKIEEAIRAALARRENWAAWGAQNRRRFESKFELSAARSAYVDLIKGSLQLT
jgi:glycosyltransferase involved in cell wall biosynthesis